MEFTYFSMILCSLVNICGCKEVSLQKLETMEQLSILTSQISALVLWFLALKKDIPIEK